MINVTRKTSLPINEKQQYNLVVYGYEKCRHS